MDVIYVLFLLFSRLRLRFVSVVFDFNVSHNDIAPLSLILFTFDSIRIEKSGLLVDTICIVSFVFTTQIKFCECCV